MYCRSKSFGKDVCNLHRGRDGKQLEKVIINLVLNDVTVNLNVFGALIKDLI